MNKRIIAVICIVVAAVSFCGGMVYKYEDYIPIVEYDYGQSKFTYAFSMPMDLKEASVWLDWAVKVHQSYIDVEQYTELEPLEFHQASIDMYVKIKGLFLKFDREWGKDG